MVDILAIDSGSGQGLKKKGSWVAGRASNRIFFHFPESEGYNRVDNRIANIVKIIE